MYTGHWSVTREYYDGVFNESEGKLVELHDRARDQLEIVETIDGTPFSTWILAADETFVHDGDWLAAGANLAVDELIGHAIPGGKNQPGGQRIGVNVPGNLPIQPRKPSPLLGALAGGGKKKKVKGLKSRAYDRPEVEIKSGTPVKDRDAIDDWDDFLGPNQTDIDPRDGLPDPDRIWSGDGKRSIRYGEHEMKSKPNKHHYHKETWFDDHVENVLQRVQRTISKKKK